MHIPALDDLLRNGHWQRPPAADSRSGAGALQLDVDAPGRSRVYPDHVRAWAWVLVLGYAGDPASVGPHVPDRRGEVVDVEGNQVHALAPRLQKARRGAVGIGGLRKRAEGLSGSVGSSSSMKTSRPLPM